MSSGNIALRKLVAGMGMLAIALVDVQSGRCLFTASAPNAPDLDMRRAARHNASILRSHLEAAIDLDLSDEIEDVLLTMGSQYHLIRSVPKREYAGLFLYLIADREQANLALARRELRETAADLTLAPGEREMLDRLQQGNTATAPSPSLSSQYAWSKGNTRVIDDSEPDYSNMPEDELPPFMRTDSVLRLLGIAPEAAATTAAAFSA